VGFRVMLFDTVAFMRSDYVGIEEKWNKLRPGHGKTTTE